MPKDTAPEPATIEDWDPPEQWDLYEFTDNEIAKLAEIAGRKPSRFPLKVKILRVDRDNSQRTRPLPTVWGFDEITTQGLVDAFGGGIYDVKIFDRGSRYVFTRRIELAGACKWTKEEIEERAMPQGANAPVPVAMTPEQRNPAAAAAYQWQVPGGAPPPPTGPTDADRRMDRLERLVEKLAERPPASPPPPPAIDVAALAAALRPPDNNESTRIFGTMLLAMMKDRNNQAPPPAAPAAPAAPAIAPGTFNLDLGQLSEMAKMLLQFQSATKGGEFLNETLPGMIEQLAPMLAVGATALTDDPEAKKAIIEAAERAAANVAGDPDRGTEH